MSTAGGATACPLIDEEGLPQPRHGWLPTTSELASENTSRHSLSSWLAKANRGYLIACLRRVRLFRRAGDQGCRLGYQWHLVAVTALLLALMAVVIHLTAVGGTECAADPRWASDLQGIWLNNTATPLERPKQCRKPLFTEEEAHELKHHLMDRAIAIVLTTHSS